MIRNFHYRHLRIDDHNGLQIQSEGEFLLLYDRKPLFWLKPKPKPEFADTFRQYRNW